MSDPNQTPSPASPPPLTPPPPTPPASNPVPPNQNPPLSSPPSPDPAQSTQLPPKPFTPPPPPPSTPAPPAGSVPSPNPTPPPSNPNPSQPAKPNDAKKGPIKKIALVVVAFLVLFATAIGAYFFLNRAQPSDQPTTSGENQVSKPTQTTTLTYWGLWESDTIIEPILQEYQNQNPGIQVEYVQQSPKDYRDRLQTAINSGNGPDIFRFHNTWLPMIQSELEPLPASVMSQQDFSSTFYPVATTDLSQGNAIYGIPLMIDGLGLYYNKTIFATAGKSPPKTWDELRTLAQDLTVKNGQIIERAGIALGTADNTDHFSDILGLMLLQNGADPADPTNSLASDSLVFYTIFVSDQTWDQTLPNSTQAFASQKAAMMIGPSWRAHEIIDLNPDLDFAVVALPQLPDSNISWASYWVEGVSSQSKNQQQAWQLLKYLSSKEVMRQLYTNASSERLFGEPFSRQDLQSELINDEIVGAYVSQAPFAQSWPMASNTHDNGLNDQVIKYYKDAVNQVNQGQDASEALETTAQGVVQVLSRFTSLSR